MRIFYILSCLMVLFCILQSEVIDVDQYDICTLDDSTSSRIQVGGRRVPSLGVFRVLVLLIDFENETEQSVVWPLHGDPDPSYTFLNAEPYVEGQTWISNNMSRYTYEMSNGLFQMIGESYRVTLENYHDYSTPTNAILAALQILDEDIDFGEYDNWNNSATNTYDEIICEPDGYVDFAFGLFRQSLSSYWGNGNTGSTAFPSYTSNDTKIINGTTYSVQTAFGSNQGGYTSGFNFVQGVCFHEFSHFLFPSNGVGSHNGRLANLSPLSGNQVGYGYQLVGMTAWEKERLCWLSYTVVETDQIVTLNDYMQNFQAVKILTNDPDNIYIIENRQKKDILYDTAFGKGLYIYRAVESGRLYSGDIVPVGKVGIYEESLIQHPEPWDSQPGQDGDYDGSINLLSADGRYHFYNNLETNYHSSDSSLLRIYRGEPDPLGYDERDYCGQYYNEMISKWKRYYCLDVIDPANNVNCPWYVNSDPVGERPTLGDSFGDIYDGFSLGYNKVFSKWSNPGIDLDWSTGTEFSIEILSENPVTGAVSFQVRFNNTNQAAPPRPMGLTANNDLNQISYALNWYQPNEELHPDFSHYNVYYSTLANSTWRLMASTEETSLNVSIPYDPESGVHHLSRKSFFKVTTVKENGQESNFSDPVTVTLNNNIHLSSLYSLPPNHSIIIEDSLIVNIDSTFEMGAGSSMVLGKGSRIVVNPSGSLNINDDCIISGTNKTSDSESGSKIIVDGGISIGTNVSFTGINDGWDGLEINSLNFRLVDASFSNADLTLNSSANISSCSFSNCTINQNNNSLYVGYSEFNGSRINSFSKLRDCSTEVEYCNFYGTGKQSAIQLNSISKYTINNNSIEGYENGISIYETINGYLQQNDISGNEVGILIYHSGMNLSNSNHIIDNNYGIVAYRNSLWSLEGSKNPPYQRVANNRYSQLLFSYDSAPEYVEFNEIYDTNSPTKPFITCTNIPANTGMCQEGLDTFIV